MWEDNTHLEGMESVGHEEQGFCSSNLGPTPIPNRVVFATEQRRDPGSYLALALDPPSADVPATKEIAASTAWSKTWHVLMSEPALQPKPHYIVVVIAAHSCLTLGDSVDCSPPGSSVHGILQARILEWVDIPFSRGSSQSRNQTGVSCIAGGFFTN